ncbi:hypothetical protein ACFP9V_10565 [Deinococcus radiopugnans]|uniref:Uncharacterized protein n=1 Tax=Deinococcus radiopugnans ATCC 19172 TaxID=585398 RepID=A0A5C4XXV3_9DEIO|nr:hypothetical protein [Deinococcus radiopugnans]MBB6018369.1 hypothetical protein [Deinococcus radiopugnans ATCC 19172]TNM67953.1 hypothetical protein FHR04_17405 [Deinococcus radiopugnans ATCC 19172]
MQKNPDSSSGVTARKGQTLTRTLEGSTYNLVMDYGAADGWYFLSLAGKELGGTAEGREGLARFEWCK